MENKRYDRLTKGLVYPLIEKYYSSGDLPSVFYKREGLSESQFYTVSIRSTAFTKNSLEKKVGLKRNNCQKILVSIKKCLNLLEEIFMRL